MLNLLDLPSYDYSTAKMLTKLHGNSTLLDLNALEDPRLSPAAKAIIVHIDNLPDGSDLSLVAMKEALTGKFLNWAVERGYKELFEHGYLADDGK